MVQYVIALLPYEMVWYSTLLHYYLMNFVVNNHVQDLGQSLMNDNLTVVSIVKTTFKE